MRKGFMKAGHLPTLFAAFLYFDMSFMVWVMLGPMGVQIAKDLQPVAGREGPDGGDARARRGAAALASPASWSIASSRGGPARSCRFSSSRGFCSPGCSACTAFPRCCWSAACWASPARPSRSRCRSPRAGIRPSTRARRSASPGPAIPARCFAALVRPGARRLASAGRTCSGWRSIPLVAHARGLPRARQGQRRRARRRSRSRDYLGVLRIGDAWWFMVFYGVTFGGFVGLASSLTIYFNDQYGLHAGDGRLLHRRLRVRRLAGAPARRRARRPRRRRALAHRHVRRRGLGAGARSASAAGRPRRRSPSWSSACWRSAWATARCSSSCRSASAGRSA